MGTVPLEHGPLLTLLLTISAQELQNRKVLILDKNSQFIIHRNFTLGSWKYDSENFILKNSNKRLKTNTFVSLVIRYPKFKRKHSSMRYQNPTFQELFS